MPDPLVSVIIPTFNRAYCVGKAIDSALGQTHQNTEILVLDDGSTDGTRDLIERSYAGDSRVRYFFHENRGVTATRNWGITLCRGRLRGPARLRRHLVPLETRTPARLLPAPPGGRDGLDRHGGRRPREVRSSADPTSGPCTAPTAGISREDLFPQSFPLAEVAPGLAPVVEDRRLYTGEIFSQMIMGNLVHTSTVLLRRDRLEKISGFNEELRLSGEDYDFHLRTCREGPVGYIDLPAIRYQIGNPDQLTQDAYRVHIAMNCLKTLRPWIEQRRSQINLPDQMLRLRLAEVHSWVGEKLVNTGESSQARVHLRKSLRHHLWQLKAWKFLALASLPGDVRERLEAAGPGAQGQARAAEGRVASRPPRRAESFNLRGRVIDPPRPAPPISPSATDHSGEDRSEIGSGAPYRTETESGRFMEMLDLDRRSAWRGLDQRSTIISAIQARPVKWRCREYRD